MRADNFNQRRKPRSTGPLTDAKPTISLFAEDDPVTSRGARYWNTGSIPLIAPDLLGDIIAAASDIALVISPEAKILSVLTNAGNPYHGRLGHWEGTNLRDQLSEESAEKLDDLLARFQVNDEPPQPKELNHSDRGFWDFPIRYSFHRIGPDGALLMLGRDLRPVAEMQQQLVRAQLALEKDYEAQRDYDTRFRVLMNVTREPLIFVSAATGKIVDANRAASRLMGSPRGDLVGAPFVQEFDVRKRADLIESLIALAVSESGTPLEVETRLRGQVVSISPSIFRAAGERVLLCRIDGGGADGDRLSDDLSENLVGLYQNGVDAIVFSDRDGVIVSANESFLDLADLAHASAAKGKSFGDFLARGTVDLKVLLENAARSGQMRLYATKLSSEFGFETSVEISATYLDDRTHPAYVFVLRDASRVDAVRKPGAPVSDDAVRSVMELVGSATLKEIVAETTDVVEKMCIETAVELTRNNRMAAAEMLGLSRQSLYVKLRKYDLLNKTPGG